MMKKGKTTRIILVTLLFVTVIAALAVQKYYAYRNSFYHVQPLPGYESNGKVVRDMFIAEKDPDFQRMKKPKPGDWLHSHPEMGQSFEDYKKINPVRRTEKRNKIVIQPIGEFSDQEMKVLKESVEFIGIYYDSSVELKEPVRNLDKKYSRNRKDGNFQWTQYNTKYMIDEVLKPRVPDDALCYFGVTMMDLYPAEDWNYCFGEASLKERVGVYSLFRYFPGHFGGAKTDDYQQTVLRRSCKVMAHELGHIFSMWHCVYYQCLMNGSNHLVEMDSRPIHLCPICREKMQWNLGFDMKERYRKLEEFYRKHGLNKEADWVKRQISK